MRKFSKCCGAILFLAVLFLTPLIQVTSTNLKFATIPGFESNTKNDYVKTVNDYPFHYDTYSSESNAQFDNLTLQNNLIIRFDSNVVMNNTFFSEARIYLYNNSKLVLRNVTFENTVRIYIHDNAELIILGGNISTNYVLLYSYEHGSAKIIDSSGDFRITLYDNSNLYIQNTSINMLVAYEYSTSTLLNSSSTGNIQLLDNASFTIVNFTATSSIYLFDQTYLYAEKLTIPSPIYLYVYDSAQAFIKNSTLYVIQTESGSDGYTTIVNSTITALYYKSMGISHVYNSTLSRIYRSFIVDGSALFEGTNLYKKGGAIQYNIILDNDTTVSNIYNYSYIYLLPGSNLNITGATTVVSYVYATLSTVTIKDSSLTWLYSFDSSVNITSSSISYPRITGGTIYISDTSMNTIYFYKDANVTGKNLVITTIFHYDNAYENLKNISISNTFSINGGTVNVNNASINGLNIDKATFVGNDVTISSKNIEVIDAEFTLTNSEYTATVLSQNFENTTVYINNLTAPNVDTSITSSNVTIVNAHAIGDITPESSNILLYNSTITNIFGKANDTSYFYISNCTITSSLSVDYYGLSADVHKSVIGSARYIVNVTKGNVEINNFKIIGNQGDYITTLTFDDKTNITNMYLSELNVKNAIVHVINQTLTNLKVYYSEANLFNVSASLLIFNGSILLVNQCTISTVAIGYSNNVQINGTIMHEMYIGMSEYYFFNISNGLPYPSAEAYGNITYSTITSVLIHFGSGSIGIQNTTISTIISTTDGHVFLYNDTITTMYQAYIFEKGGLIYNYREVKGFNSTAIYNVTGNMISNVMTAYVAVYSGILTVNNSLVLISAYNDSKVYVFNNSQVAGITARDTSYVYIENSQLISTDISSVVALDSSKVIINSSNINQAFFVHDNAQYEIYNSRMYGNTEIKYYINVFDNGKVFIFNSTATGSGSSGFIITTGSSRFSATYFNVTLLKTSWYTPPDETFYFEKNSHIVWNHSFIMVQEVLTPIILRDSAYVLFYNVTFNATYSLQYYSIRIMMYNSTSFNGIHFNYVDASVLTYTMFALTDSSNINVDTVKVDNVNIMGKSTAYLRNIDTIQIYLASNASMTLVNDDYGGYVIPYIFFFGNSSGTIENATIENINVYGGTCYMNNVRNSTTHLNIYVYGDGKVIANNITANKVTFDYLETTQPYPVSEIKNSTIDVLIRSITFHRSGNVTFTGYSFTALPTTIEFQHVSVLNTIIGEDNLIVNFKDNLKVTGANAIFTSMYIGLVNDTVSPVISISPTTLSFEKGLKGKIITISINETFPDMYVIYRNGNLFQQGFYKNNQPIIVDVSGFSAGNWTLEVFANDTTGNYDTATAQITIYPSEPPVIVSSPPDTYEMIVGTTGNSLSWTAVDHSPAYFLLYVNGELEINDTWSSNDPIEYIIDSFDEGTYNVTIVFYDLLGNKASGTVTVSVTRGFLGTGLSFQTIVLIVAGIAGIALVIAVILRIRKAKTVKSKKTKKTKKRK